MISLRAMRSAAAATIFRSTAAPSPICSTAKQVLGGAEHLGQRAEAPQQGLGTPLGVGARNGAKEKQFQNFIIGKRVGARLAKSFAQTLAMSQIMRLFVGWLDGAHCRRPLFGEKAALILIVMHAASAPAIVPQRFEFMQIPGGNRFRFSGRVSGRQARPIEALGRQRKDFAAGRRDANRVLVLCRKRAVAGNGGPAIG